MEGIDTYLNQKADIYSRGIHLYLSQKTGIYRGDYIHLQNEISVNRFVFGELSIYFSINGYARTDCEVHRIVDLQVHIDFIVLANV